MSKLRSVFCAIAAILSWVPAVSAEPVAGAAPPKLAQAAPTTAPSSTNVATGAPVSTNTGSEPELPRLDDAMLTPPPPAAHVLSTWQQALGLLRQNSTTLRTSRARIQQAQAQTKVALAPALPTLTGTGSVTDYLLLGEHLQVNPTGNGTETVTVRTQVPTNSVIYSAALGLRVPLFAPKAWYDHGTAKDAVDTAALDAKEIERQQVALVASAIVSVVTSERLAEVSRVSLGSALSTLDLTKRRAALGASSMVDVLRVEQEVSASRAQVVSAQETLMRARETLGDALGFSEGWSVTPEIQLDALANDARTSCTQEAGVDLRPDVRAAGASSKLAERNLTSVDYSFLPTVDGVSNLTYYAPETSSPNYRHLSWTIGGLLTWQIYDGGLRYGTRDSRRADLEIARQRLTEVRRRALLEVTQSMRGVKVAEANLAVSQRARFISSETARLTRIAYLNGTGTSFDLVDSARRLREAELDFAIKEFEVLRAKITALLALATCNV